MTSQSLPKSGCFNNFLGSKFKYFSLIIEGFRFVQSFGSFGAQGLCVITVAVFFQECFPTLTRNVARYSVAYTIASSISWSIAKEPIRQAVKKSNNRSGFCHFESILLGSYLVARSMNRTEQNLLLFQNLHVHTIEGVAGGSDPFNKYCIW